MVTFQVPELDAQDKIQRRNIPANVIQDIVAAMVEAGTGANVIWNATTRKLTIATQGGGDGGGDGTGYTAAQIRTIIADTLNVTGYGTMSVDAITGEVTINVQGDGGSTGGPTGSAVSLVNGSSGEVWLGFDDLDDTAFTPFLYDPLDPDIVTGGIADKAVPFFDRAQMRWVDRQITGDTHSHEGQYAPVGYTPPFFVPIYMYNSAAGETVPPDFPADGLLWDDAEPAAERIEDMNTQTLTSAAYTLPDVATATVHRLTLTANVTITPPAHPPAGQAKSILVVFVQDATGGRTPTLSGVTLPAGASSVLPDTVAGAVYAVVLTSLGTTWRASSAEKWAS